jgi:elongation factor G
MVIVNSIKVVDNIDAAMNKRVEENIILDNIARIRNIGFIAHIDAGKTTTTERVLYLSGKIQRIGEVDEGTATMDWMIQEKERGITITSAVTTCYWEDKQINIIDTPGHIDFTIEVERSLRVLDGAIVIFCGVNGVEAQSETVWMQANKYNVPRIAFINKMDREEADFYNVVKQIEEKLSANPLIVTLPYYEDGRFCGVIDLIKMKLFVWDVYDNEGGKKYVILEIPTEYKDKVIEYRSKLLEKLSDIEDSIVEYYLKGEDIKESVIINTVRKGTMGGKLIPVLCGSALKNIGIQPLLSSIVWYLPSPLDRGEIIATSSSTKEEVIISPWDIDKNKFCGLVFKLQNFPYIGKLYFLRIYSGCLKSGQVVENSSNLRKWRITKMYRLHANYREEIREAYSGDIVGVIGPKDTYTGDTLCDDSYSVMLEPIYTHYRCNAGVVSLGIEPKSKADIEKLFSSLETIKDEDPTFSYRIDEETNQIVLSGMGELHLEIIVDRLRREFNVGISVGEPQVAYKETITEKTVGESAFEKCISGKSHYAYVKLEILPLDRDRGVEIINLFLDTAVPPLYLQAVTRGVKNGLEKGIRAGFQIIDVKVNIIEVRWKEKDTSELSFEIAASLAVKDAVSKVAASSIILEPIMKLDIISPKEYIGDIMSDLNTRNGKILHIEDKMERSWLTALVPLRTVFGYATILRSLSKGRAIYTLEPYGHDRVREELENKLLEMYV